MLAEHVLGSAWLLTGAIAGAATFGLSSRAMAAVAGAVGVSAFALGAPQAFRLGLLHAHNLIALAVWLLLFRRGLRLVWLPIVIVLGAAAVLASGMTLHWTMRHGFTTLLGLPIFEVADWIAPGLSTEGALALTLLFAFLQSVHYAVWLVAIPQDDARAAASPNYRMKVRALRKDFGVVGLALVLGSMLLMAAASPWSPLYARSLYLSLATFHFWLELATLAFFGARDSA
jgi:hypothetical protein